MTTPCSIHPLVRKGGSGLTLRNHTTSCTINPEMSIRHPPAIRSLPSITKPPRITAAGVLPRAPANAKLSTGRSQVTSGPRPPTAHAPAFRPPLLTILYVLPARLSRIPIPQAAGSWQLASDSLRPPACLVFSASPGLNVIPPPHPPPHQSLQALLGLAPTPQQLPKR